MPGERKEAVRALIAEAKGWRQDHARAGRQIETLGCDIRIKAIEDALAALDRPESDDK
ncbi:MAG: hypothetical protein ACTHJQ_03355 [Rhizobiaceae bacterium]